MRAILAIVFLILGGAASAQTRHALVIGIDAYAEIAPLAAAVNDARSVAAALERQGYAVTLLATPAETTQIGLVEAIAIFADSIRPGDVALFFFAGHGIEIEGRNFLIPVDIPNLAPDRAGAERLLQYAALSVEQVIEDLRAGDPQAVILILDACRDNPFARDGTRSLGETRGLGRIAARSDVFVLYSAGIGEAALDRLSEGDPDPNSVFTRSLLPLLAEPGRHPAEIARDLRGEVRRLAESVNHDQSPAYYDELSPDFVLIPAAATAAAAPAKPPPASLPAPAPADPPPPAGAHRLAPAEPAPPHLCYLQVASRMTLIEVRQFVAAYQRPTSLSVYEAANGWFAIVEGQIARDGQEATVAGLVAERLIPFDAICAAGQTYRFLVDPDMYR